MYLEDLRKYDLIVIWGCGNEFRARYKKQFYVNYIIDNDNTKIGKSYYGIEIISSSIFLEKAVDKNVLIIISTELYHNEIVQQIYDLNIICDIVKMKDMDSLYGCNNKNFALWGLDVLAKDLLERCGYQISDMSFIEVGANHPIYGNVTEGFYLQGARGFMVEANPDLISAIKYYREGDTCLNYGIAEKRGSMPFYRFDNSYRSSFDKLQTEKNIQRGFQLMDVIDVDVITLDEMIAEYKIDTSKTFLSLELMGLEKKVLKGFTYKNYDFPLISIAYYDNEVLEYEIFKDYCVIANIPRHAILIRQDLYGKIIN